MMNAEEIISKLQLIPHPEGGFFREIYRSSEIIHKNSLPDKYSGNRNFATIIYFLLRAGDISKFHRLQSDEIWHFHCGQQLEILILRDAQEPEIIRLGNGFLKDESPAAIITAGKVFGARVAAGGEFSLISCTVSPGFDFDDFEMLNRDFLIVNYPEHKALIEIFT